MNYLSRQVWHLVLQSLELHYVCMFGAASRSAAVLAFSCEAVWGVVRLPRKHDKAARGILKLGASLGRPLCRHLDATSTPFFEDSALAAAAAAGWMPRLERVNLTGCRRIQSAVVTIAERCTALTVLQSAGCARLSDTEIVGICQHAGSRLVSLDLSGCSSKIGDASAQALGFCTALKELRLSACKKLSDQGVESMLMGGAQPGNGGGAGSRRGVGGTLVSLELSSCEKLSDKALVALARFSSGLLHLDLSLSDHFSSHMISHVLACGRQLKTLDLVGVRGVNDEALSFLPTTLESIALAACRISDRGVRSIAERCTSTHSLDLAANDNITDAGFAALATLPHLRNLNLNYTCASDVTLEAFAGAVPGEAGLDAGSCGGSGCRSGGGSGSERGLLVLNLRGCKNVTEEGVSRFSDVGHALIHLDVRDTGVLRLAGGACCVCLHAVWVGARTCAGMPCGASFLY